MRSLLLLLALSLGLSGCAAGRADAPARTALAFATAVAAHDGSAACALLAPGTRKELESSQSMPCPQALLSQQLPTSRRLSGSERLGDEARIVLDQDTEFLARFSLGWRVVAVGCTDRGQDRPYDCTVKGG